MVPIPSNSEDYRVRILYREPTYELRAGGQRESYLFDRIVKASGHEDALRTVMAEFRETKGASGVGWVRVVTRVEVEWLLPDGEAGAKP